MTPIGPLPPGATIGVLGGGQLGRMMALAAAPLGYRTHVFAPAGDQPATAVAAAATRAPYEDAAALAAFAAAVSVVTFEFENVPTAALAALEGRVPCRPGLRALRTCQDRLLEKAFLETSGVPVAPWHAVDSAAELDAAIAAIGLPAVLKTTRMGYDGHGQAVLRDPSDAAPAWERLRPRPLILESWVGFAAELSVLVARDVAGRMVAFDPTENRHADGMLALSLAPARVAPAVAAAALAHGAAVAAALDLVGVLALELFLLPDGRLLGNEIAPRPHNSGHWTIDACAAGQFTQHVRAVAGLPLAEPSRYADAVMRNLIGPEGLARWPALLAAPDVVPHHYGKGDARPGRKLGHATRLLPRGTLATLPAAALLAGL